MWKKYLKGTKKSTKTHWWWLCNQRQTIFSWLSNKYLINNIIGKMVRKNFLSWSDIDAVFHIDRSAGKENESIPSLKHKSPFGWTSSGRRGISGKWGSHQRRAFFHVSTQFAFCGHIYWRNFSSMAQSFINSHRKQTNRTLSGAPKCPLLRSAIVLQREQIKFEIMN